jgi:hypothetical protein
MTINKIFSKFCVIVASSLLFSFITSGCTQQLWQAKNEKHLEKLSGIRLDAELNRLYVIGVKHSYVFNVDNGFEQILILSRTLQFSPTFSVFRLKNNNEISGSVELKIDTKQLDAKQVSGLTELGFNSSGLDQLSYKIKLIGTRYKGVGDFPLEKSLENFHVEIEFPSGAIETAGKIIWTPVAVATDAAIVVCIGSVAVLVAPQVLADTMLKK